MKNLLGVSRYLLFSIFILSFVGTITECTSLRLGLDFFNRTTPVFSHKEKFDASLARLNSIDRLESYCDSLFHSAMETGSNAADHYPMIAEEAVKQRFYHGFSHYGFGDNFLSLVLDPLVPNYAMSAIVIPDDILKYPYAACSQQSIVLMNLLQRKGFSTRRIGFQSSQGGHFCFEVFYDGKWHFYDPDYEPDEDLLRQYGMPDAKFLQQNPRITETAYRAMFNPEQVQDLFSNISYGNINEMQGPKAYFYQKATRFLSRYLWLLSLVAFIFVRYRFILLSKRHVRNSRFYFPELQTGQSIGHYSMPRA